MQVHYIEDDVADAMTLKAMARRHPDLEISVSSSLEDLPKYILEKPLDCILLDVNRPESVSFTEDIRQVRHYTSAPVIFVTGGKVDDLRLDAIRAGAESLLDKNSLSPAMLREVMDNVQARFQATQEVLKPSTPAARRMYTDINLSELDTPLEYIHSSLQLLTDAMLDSGFDTSAGLLNHLSETTEAIRTLAGSKPAGQSGVKLDDLFDRVRRRIVKIATHKKITLSIESMSEWYSQAGTPPLTLLGVQHVIEGLMRAALPSSTMLVYVTQHNRGVKLMLYFSKKVLPDTDSFFKTLPKSDFVGLDAACSIRLGALLLQLQKGQVRTTSNRDDQMITIEL